MACPWFQLIKFEPESDLIFETKTETKVCICEELDLKLDSQFHSCVGFFRKVKNYPTPVSIWVHLKLIEPKGKTLATRTISQSIDEPNLHLNPFMAECWNEKWPTMWQIQKLIKLIKYLSWCLPCMSNTLWQSVLFFKGVCQKLTMQNTIEKVLAVCFCNVCLFLKKTETWTKKDTMNISVEKGSRIFPVWGVF